MNRQEGGRTLSGVRCYSLSVVPLPSVPIGEISLNWEFCWLLARVRLSLPDGRSFASSWRTKAAACAVSVRALRNVAPNGGPSRSVSIRPVLKHGPRSLPCTRVARSCIGPGGVMKVKLRGCNRSQ